MFDVLQREPSPHSMVCNTAGGFGDARSVIRGLLVVGPAALLVACGVPAAQSGYADNPARKEAAVATRVVTSTSPGVDEVAAGPSAVGGGAPGPSVAQADDVPPRNVAENGCNRNYRPCVPDDPVDVDCVGGSGNGPSYVAGPVLVVGKDVYGLDANHNGVGCEAGAAVTSAPAPREASQPTSRPVARPPSTRPPTTPTATTPTVTTPTATTKPAPTSKPPSTAEPFRSSSGCGATDSGGDCP